MTKVDRKRSWPAVLTLCVMAVVAIAQPARGEFQWADARELTALAETGRFTDVLTRLRAVDEAGGGAEVHALITELQRYQANEASRDTARSKAYDEALAKAAKKLADDDIEGALVAAIEAHSLAASRPLLLKHPTVQTIVTRALAAAIKQEESKNWVEAVALYRLLNLLFEEDGAYKDHARRVSRHVRVLQIYNPELLEKLYTARAERRAKLDDKEDRLPEPGQVDHEQWNERLKGIDTAMLRQTLAHASTRHVDGGGYASLMRGGVDGLLLFLDTDGLTDVFPSLKNGNDVRAFRAYLQRVRTDLARPNASLNYLETANLVDQIVTKNRGSVDLPESVIIYELTEGATETLDDFSSVIWPKDKEHFSRSTQGKFYGVGIQISRRDGRLIVVSPLENTPAQRAGIKAEDIIATVDGKKTDSWSLDRAVREITGPEHTPVVLGVERAGEAKLLKFRILRAEIVIESIKGWEHKPAGGWNWWIDEHDRIGYVRMSQFIPQTVEALDEAVFEMQKDGPINGLILDLRFNPGGLLSSAVDVADRFIESGPLVSTVDGKGRRTNESRARKLKTYADFPVVVLVNQGSASASEIVSGALQDYGRAHIVGTRSFGKGSVQDLFRLAQGEAYLKLTTQYYQLPLGRIIHRKPDARTWGIEPDLKVEMTNQQVADAIELRQEVDIIRDGNDVGDAEKPMASDILKKGLDPQLEAALLVLKTRHVANGIAMADAGKQPVRH